MTGRKPQTLAQAIERYTKPGISPDDCWTWIGSTDKDGYGHFDSNSKTIAGHRASWIVHNGEIPNRLHVLHRCDNPPCCNPAHLFLGTHSDNMADGARKGRFPGRPLIAASAILAVLISCLVWMPSRSRVEAQGGLVIVTSSVQVTGSGAVVHPAASGTARWIQVNAITGNSATVNCGGSTVSTTIGVPIAAGGGMFLPPMPFDSRLATNQSYYSLATVSCYVANGDKVNFTWAN